MHVLRPCYFRPLAEAGRHLSFVSGTKKVIRLEPEAAF